MRREAASFRTQSLPDDERTLFAAAAIRKKPCEYGSVTVVGDVHEKKKKRKKRGEKQKKNGNNELVWPFLVGPRDSLRVVITQLISEFAMEIVFIIGTYLTFNIS